MSVDQLYELIGGKNTVHACIERFYRKVLDDQSLRPFFGSTDMAHLQQGQSMFLSMLLGGKVVYTGKDLGAAHARSRIQGLSDDHFDAFLQHFREALKEVGVETPKAEKVLQLLEERRSAVVKGKSEGAAG